MKRPPNRPGPPRAVPAPKLPGRTAHTTVTPRRIPRSAKPPLRARRPAPGPKRLPAPKGLRPPSRKVARIVAEDEASLLDLIDNLLGKGVMLNADLILALANVDLVYVRLSALLCAADRVLPRFRDAGATASSRLPRR